MTPVAPRDLRTWLTRRAATSSRVFASCSVAMKVKAVAVEILDGELRESPWLLFQRLGDVRAERLHVAVHVVDLRRVHPVHGGLEGPFAAAQEDRGNVAVDRTDLFARVQPAYVEAPLFAVVLLRAPHIGNRQFGHRGAERR